MATLAELLSRPLDDIKKPAPLPNGTYHGLIASYEVGNQPNEKQTPFVQLNVQMQRAGDDVDPIETAGIDFTKRAPMRIKYWLTPTSEWRLKALLESCSVPTAGRSFNETLPELTNQPVLMSCLGKPGRDGDIFLELDTLKGDSQH